MKLLAALLLVIVTTGCTTPSRMDVHDLNHYKIDCDRQDEQLAFLVSQLPTTTDKHITAFRLTSPFGTIASMVDGTYYEERAVYDQRQLAIIRLTIYQIQTYCPKPVAKPQGCVHLNESFPAGTSQGARCYQNGRVTPVVNRWEVVDPK